MCGYPGEVIARGREGRRKEVWSSRWSNSKDWVGWSGLPDGKSIVAETMRQELSTMGFDKRREH